MSEERSIGLSSNGPPETVLPPPPEPLTEALAVAVGRDAVAPVVAGYPTWSVAWAALGDHGRDDLERYAAYRVGYHRGLDLLRQSGWRGSGYVRWRYEPNRGFLRSLWALSVAAGRIGEAEEQERCAQFLRDSSEEAFQALSA